MDQGSKSPILFIITGLLTVIFGFNNCGVGFEANSVTEDLGSILGFNKTGQYLLTTQYNDDGEAEIKEVPYSVENNRIMLWGHTDIGSIYDIKNGDHVETPQLASDSRISQINMRRAKLDSSNQQAVNKGGYLSSIHRDGNGKRVFFYYWRGGSEQNGNVRFEPASSALRTKIQNEIDKLNKELSDENINLEFRVRGNNGHNATVKTMILSELRSDLYATYWTHHQGKASNPETSFKASASPSYIGAIIRQRIMIELGFVEPLYTNKRNEIYNIRTDKINQKGKELLANPFTVGSDSQFFSADSVLTHHSCWKNVRSDCSVTNFNSGELSFTLKDGDRKVYLKSAFTNSDLKSIKSIYGSLDDSGQAVDVISKLVAIYVSPNGEFNAIGYACKPFSNESVDLLIYRQVNNANKWSNKKFTANQNFIPRADIPDECTNANGDKRTDVAFHATGSISELGLTTGYANDYGWFNMYIDKDSAGLSANKLVPGNGYHNNSLHPHNFKNGIFDSSDANNTNNKYFQFVWKVYNVDRQHKYCTFNIETYNNTPNPNFIENIDLGAMTSAGICKSYVLQKLFGFNSDGSSDNSNNENNNSSGDGEVVTDLNSSHYGKFFAIVSDQSPGFKGTVYKYVSDGVSCIVPSNEYNGSNTIKLTPDSYAILVDRYFIGSPSCNDLGSSSGSGVTYQEMLNQLNLDGSNEFNIALVDPNNSSKFIGSVFKWKSGQQVCFLKSNINNVKRASVSQMDAFFSNFGIDKNNIQLSDCEGGTNNTNPGGDRPAVASVVGKYFTADGLWFRVENSSGLTCKINKNSVPDAHKLNTVPKEIMSPSKPVLPGTINLKYEECDFNNNPGDNNPGDNNPGDNSSNDDRPAVASVVGKYFTADGLWFRVENSSGLTCKINKNSVPDAHKLNTVPKEIMSPSKPVLPGTINLKYEDCNFNNNPGDNNPGDNNPGDNSSNDDRPAVASVVGKYFTADGLWFRVENSSGLTCKINKNSVPDAHKLNTVPKEIMSPSKPVLPGTINLKYEECNFNNDPSDNNSGAGNVAGLQNLKALRYGSGGEIQWDNPSGVSIKKVVIDCLSANQILSQSKSNGERSVYYGQFRSDGEAICRIRVESNDGRFSRVQRITVPARGNGTQVSTDVTVD